MKKWMTPDRWTAVTCLFIGILITLAIPSQTSSQPIPGARGFDLLDGAFFPKIAVALFMVASIWLFFEPRPPTDDGETATPAPHATLAEDEPPGITLRDFFWAAVISGAVLVYVQFLVSLGFVLSRFCRRHEFLDQAIEFVRYSEAVQRQPERLDRDRASGALQLPGQ